MTLSRPLNNPAPTFRYEFRLNTISEEPIAEPAIHARYREPNPQFVELQQWLQFRQPQGMLLHFSLGTATDDSVKVCLHLEQNSGGNAPLQLWSENTEQM
jgi:hypothetical protein